MTRMIREHPSQSQPVPAGGVEHWRQLPFLLRAPCHFNRKFLAQQVAVVVAHPDDETIGCGALLCRTSAVPVILVTDGSPRNPSDASKLGFATAEAYAEARSGELRNALRIAEIPDNRLVALGLRDQDVTLNIGPLARQLADNFLAHNSQVVLTHAYEGGHPDHDSTALAVHLAAELLARRGHSLGIYEMPFYRLGDGGTVYQRFAPGGAPEIVIALTPEETELKRMMMQGFVTQASVLAPFALDAERFRAAPPDRFFSLPNAGQLLYERHDWGMTGERWLSLAREAMAQIAGAPAA